MKHYLLSKTLVLTTVLMLCAGLFAQRSFGQVSASATWALTSTSSDADVGALSATSLAKGSGIAGTVTFGATGASSTGWNTTTLSTTRYYEFDVTPTTGNNLTVTSMSIFNSLSAGTGNVQIQYSVGTSFGTGSVVGTFTVGTTEAPNAFNSLSIAVNSGQTIFIRVYAYGLSNTSAAFRARNFVVSGTTLAVSPTLNAAAGATVDNSFNVTFTDNSAWRSAITSVQWGSTTLVSGTDYTLSAGVLKIIPGGAIKTSGTQNLTIVATNFNNDVVSQIINGGAATTLNYVPAISSPQTTGTAFSVTIKGTDQFGNNANGSLTLSANSGSITPATATLINGTVTTSEKLTAQGSITITATATTAANVAQTITVNFTSATNNYFKSNGGGSWTAASTWQSSYDNVNFYNATLAPTNSATAITIQAADVVFATGQPSTNNLTVNGTYEQRFDGGTIPTATWNSGSTCLITGVTSNVPTNMGQTFYNLSWNSSMSGALTWGNSIPTNISGDLTFISTGIGSLRMSNSGATLTVGGNLNIQGGTFNFDNGGTVASTLNINGDVNLTGGNFQPNGAPASTRAHSINVKGNWLNNGGAYTAGSETVMFNGTLTQTIGGSSSTTFNDVVISNTNASGVSVAINTNASSVTLNNATVLAVNSPSILAVINAVTLINQAAANTTGTLTGSGTINAGSLSIGNNTSPTSTGTTRTHILISNINAFNISGNLSILSRIGTSSTRIANGSLLLESGSITVGGNVSTTNGSTNNSTLDMSQGAQTGTLNLAGASPFNLSATATNTIKLNGSGATVNYTGSSAQNIYSGSVYTNLGVSGGSIKSLTGATSAASLNLSSDNATSGKIDASAFVLTLTSPTVSNASSAGYVITGNTSGVGKLTVNGIGTNSFSFPIGTLADYLPAAILPASIITSWSANVFTPATTDAAYNSGNNFPATALADIVNAVWNITPSNTSTTAILTLNWTSDLEGSAFSGYSNANIGISHYNGSVWQNATATGGADNAANTVTSQFSSFSPFGVGSIANPLPITIINFKAVLNSNNTVSLTWQTTVEENSDHFDVERSSDGSHWNSIGTVEAQGNSEIVNNYSYLDASPASGVNYYRLNMIDKNGSHSYTEVKVVNMNAIASFRIFPNPAKDFVNVTLGRVSGNSTIRLINLGGQTVFTQQLNNESGNTVSIPVQNLAQGTYMLQLSGSDGSQHTGQIIIVR